MTGFSKRLRLAVPAGSAALVAGLFAAPAHSQTAGAGAGGASPKVELPLKFAPQPTTAAITVQDLMSRLYVFADDSMQGREAGTPGHVRATAYIVR